MKFQLIPNKRLAVPIMTHPGIELTGKTVKDAVTDGQVHANAIIAIANATPSDAATVIMDLTVEVEAFGAKINFPENEVPTVSVRLLDKIEDVESLEVPSLNKARVPEYLKANKIASMAITDRPVLAGCIGPFSLAGRIYDMSDIMMSIYIEPDMTNLLLEKCTEFLIQYVIALKETGVDGLVIAEPAAGLLSNEDAIKFSTQFVKRIVDAVQDDNFIVILHNCGNTGHCTKSMIDSGARGLHFGNKINMLDVLKEVPEDIIVMGNLDPVGVFKQLSADEVAEATRSLLISTSDYKNFIISTGCDIPPGVNDKNIQAFYKEVSSYNSI